MACGGGGAGGMLTGTFSLFVRIQHIRLLLGDGGTSDSNRW